MSGFGKDRTFVELDQKVVDKMDEFDIRSLSHVMYSYGFREQGNPELHKKWIKRLESQSELMDHHTLSNVLYYLMFVDNKDEALWKKMIDNTLQQDKPIPLTHYTPFKMSRYYIQHHFPEWDIRDYYDKFFYPERFYNTQPREQYFMRDKKMIDFLQFLVGHFSLVALPFISFHNLFILRYCFMEQKIAINYYSDPECLPQERRLSARQKLDGKIMGYEGWEVLNISQKEHEDFLTEDRLKFYRDWIVTAKEKQIEKGIIPREEPQYV